MRVEGTLDAKKGQGLVVTYQGFLAVAFLYLVLPLIIFFFGFLKIYWAILFSALVGAVAFLCVKSVPADKKIEVKKYYPILVFALCLLWVFIAGVGEFTWSTTDHNVRAAVLNDLINYDWPVVYDLSTQSNPEVASVVGEGEVAFAYYFLFWMIPSLAGKAFGVMTARIVLLIWSALGLTLTVTGLGFIQKKPAITALVLFFFFGGFDAIPYFTEVLTQHIESSFEGWNREFYIHGDYYQTMNTFNQAIPCWLITLIVLTIPGNKYIGFAGSLMFGYSPWSTIGLLPIALCRLLMNKDERRAKNIFSPGNILVPLVMLSVFGLYYTANTGATSLKGFIWEFFPGQIPLMILCYLLYVIVEFGVWCALVWKKEKHNIIFLISIITLLVMPVYKITKANDFLMRGSLAPMFVIMVAVLIKLDESVARLKENGNDVKALLTPCLVFVSGFTAIMLMLVVIGSTKQIITGEDTSVPPRDQIVSFGDIRDESQAEVVQKQFFVYNYEDRPFYKIFGK